MDQYYKYHCGHCGTEWTKDDETFVKGLLTQRYEILKSEVENRIVELETSRDKEDATEEEKEYAIERIKKGKEVLASLVATGPDKHEEYMNGVNCPKCGSNSISGQEKEK